MQADVLFQNVRSELRFGAWVLFGFANGIPAPVVCCTGALRNFLRAHSRPGRAILVFLTTLNHIKNHILTTIFKKVKIIIDDASGLCYIISVSTRDQ